MNPAQYKDIWEEILALRTENKELSLKTAAQDKELLRARERFDEHVGRIQALRTELSELRTKYEREKQARDNHAWLRRERELGSIDMDYP